MHPIQAIGVGPGLGLGQLPPDQGILRRGIRQGRAPVEQRQGLQHPQPAAAGWRHGADAVLQLHAAEGITAHDRVSAQIGWSPAPEGCRGAAQAIDAIQDLLGQRPSVERRSALAGQSGEGAGQGRIAEGLIRGRRLTTGEIERLKRRAVGHPETLGQTQGAQEARTGLKSFRSRADCRRQGLGPGQAAVLLVGAPEQGHGSGDADGQGAAGGLAPGQRCARSGEEIAGLTALRCNFPAIEHRKRLGGCVPVEKEAAASEAGALGFDHRQNCLGCDQGIDGAAARLQCRKASGRGEGIGADHHRTAAGGDAAFAALISGFRIVAADRCCPDWGDAAEHQAQQHRVAQGDEGRQPDQTRLYPSLVSKILSGRPNDSISWRHSSPTVP